MKSPMVTIAEYIPSETKSGYSKLQVLKSGAGYYIGTIYTDKETGLKEPGSRDSSYFRTREEAEKELEIWKKIDSTGETPINARLKP